MTGADCPELEQLERSPLPPAVRAHVSACSSCKLVLDVFDVAGSASGGECLRYEPLLAARVDGTLNAAGANLLDRHVASCSTCRALESMLPAQDAVADHAVLPQVPEANYDIGLEIGRGGMGRVLAARDLRIGRPVAIKELRGKSPSLAARFEREARVTARLQHPGIVPIYEIGHWPDGTPFYAMRMVDGRMLRVAIDRATSLVQRLAMLPNVIAACEAVAFAHGQRVIHRDLTPSNILVGSYGETVVIDWGLAKDLTGGSEDPEADDPYRTTPEGNALTGVGTVVGTAAYMPPEQARADVVDERADVYALGAILYHLLAGRSPYPATAGALEAVKAGPPTPIEKVAPRAPRDLVSIVTKAMARDPRDRYPSARELADELRRFQTGRLVEAHVYTRLELIKRFVNRHRAPVIVVVAATLVLAAIAYVSVSRILTSRSTARETVRQLVVEKGRVELLAGNSGRAAAYLYDAYRDGARTPDVRLMLDQAVAGLDSASTLYDCGGDARWVELSPDGKALAAACHDRGKIVSGAEHTLGGGNGFDWVRYTDDGSRLVTSGDDGVARLWESSGKLLRTFKHGDRPITFSTFTHDGTRLLTTGFDGNARIWDTATGALLREIQVSNVPVYGVISHEGRRIVFTMTINGDGKGWDADTGEQLGKIDHGAQVLGAELSRDGKLAITCGLDSRVKVWEIPSERLIYTLDGHTDAVWKCVFSRDTKLALTAGNDGTARVWDLATGRMITSVSHGTGVIVWSAHFDRTGTRFYTLGADGRVKVWDVHSGALLSAFDTARGKYAAFSQTGQLAIARGDGRVQVVQDPSGGRIGYTPAPDRRLVDVSPDGQVALVEDRRTLLHPLELYATRTGERLGTLAIRAPVSIGKRGQLAAVSDAGVAIVDMHTGAAVKQLAPDCTPSALHLAGSGERLAIVCPGGGKVVDIASGHAIAQLPGITELMLSDDGARAITLANHRAAGVWTIATGARMPLPLTGDVIPLGFADGGKRVAFASIVPKTRPHVVTLLDADSGRPLLVEQDTNVTPGFDPTGRWLTTIGSDREVTVWSTDSGRSTHPGFSTDSSSMMVSMLGAQASPDGELLATIGDYGMTLAIVNARTGLPLMRWAIAHDPPDVSFTGFTAAVARATWTPDGTAVIALSTEVAVWPARHGLDDDKLASIVRKRVPWKVENGELRLVRHAHLAGVITRHGQPLSGARIQVGIRTVLTGASELDYATAKTQFETRTATSNEDGTFDLPGLIPGEYSVTVDGEEHVVTVGIDDREIDIDLTR
jgi:eukaryotic-like serine/threonine-protein kinase